MVGREGITAELGGTLLHVWGLPGSSLVQTVFLLLVLTLLHRKICPHKEGNNAAIF